VPLKIAENTLLPISDIRIRAFQINDIWFHEIKLIQLPIAMASTFSNILGTDPNTTIRRIQAGSSATVDGVTVLTDEVQAFTIDPSFDGTYQIVVNGHYSQFFSASDTIETIQAGLNAIGIAGAVFTVTTPTLNNVYIDFGGTLAGQALDLMSIVVGEHGPGDIQVILDLQNANVDMAFRAARSISLGDYMLEIELILGEDGETSELTPGRPLTLFREPITIAAEAIYNELSTITTIDWTHPSNPTSYISFDPSTVITGSQFYTIVIGDGVHSSFVVIHNLHTKIGHVTLFNNSTNEIITANAGVTIELTTDDTITVTFPNVIASGSVVFTFMTAGPVSAFVNGLTINQSQVNGLVTRLNNIESRLTTLEAFIPSVGGGVLGNGSSDFKALTINLGNKFEIINFKPPKSTAGATITLPSFAADGSGIDPKTLPTHGAILQRALSVASLRSLTIPLPAASGHSDEVNTAASDVSLGQKYGGTVVSGDPIMCDGLIYYAGEKGYAADSTYYAKAFSRVLWKFGINDVMMAVNSRLDVAFGLAAQIVLANTDAEWVLAIEKGTYGSLTTPGTPDFNLSGVTWDTENPIIAQKIFVSPLLQTHTFGLRLKRTGNTSFTMDKMSYGFFSGANSLAPATANFAMRARLYKFDISDDVVDARGWIAYQIVPPLTTDGASIAQAVITPSA
jgi:hypothetical protein